MKKIITESQIRFVVRNELKNYLVQEGFFDTIKQTFKDIGKDIAEPWKKQTKSQEFSQIQPSLVKLQIKPESIATIKVAYDNLFSKDKDGNFIYGGQDLKYALNRLSEVNSIISQKYKIEDRIAKTTKRDIPMQEQTSQQTQTTTDPYEQLRQNLKAKYNQVIDMKEKSEKKGLKAMAYAMMILDHLIRIANLILQTKVLSPAHREEIKKIYEGVAKNLTDLSAATPSSAGGTPAPAP